MDKPVPDIRSLQKPLKEQYRREPQSSRITLTAKGGQTDTPLSCSVDIGRAIYQAEAHKGVGGGQAPRPALAIFCWGPWPPARSLLVSWLPRRWEFKPDISK